MRAETREERYNREVREQYVIDAELIEHAGPFCWAEPCTGGIRLHFQQLDVDLDGHYSLRPRGATPLHSGVDRSGRG